MWKGWDGNAHVHDLAKAGYRTLKSSNWYLDLGETNEWTEGYLADPDRFLMDDPGAQKHVEGGEACLWGEKIDVSWVELLHSSETILPELIEKLNS